MHIKYAKVMEGISIYAFIKKSLNTLAYHHAKNFFSHLKERRCSLLLQPSMTNHDLVPKI